VKICDEAGAPVPDGTTGELWVKGPNVCSGYWRRPEATAAAWRDGWFQTGDVGVRALDGYITLMGRRSDLIISGGFNIYPREIEEVILEQPGVREVAVVGAPDPVRGEVPVAYVVVDPARFDEAAIAAQPPPTKPDAPPPPSPARSTAPPTRAPRTRGASVRGSSARDRRPRSGRAGWRRAAPRPRHARRRRARSSGISPP